MKRSDWVRDLLQKSCLMPWCLHDDLSYQTPPTQPITALHSWLTATGLNRRMGETILQARGGYHSLAGLFIPTPAVWEPLTFPLTFLQRSWLPPCCSWVTQTLINACDIWRGISDWADISLHHAWPTSPHSWRTGLYLVARSHTASSSDSVHTEKSCCSKSVLVQLCEQVQSVRHICCVLCKCVWADAIWTAELLQYTPNPWWLLQTLYTCLELNLAADECGSASLFQICRSAFRMNKLTITAAVWQSLLNTRHSSSNQILKSLILRRIKVFFLYTGWVHLST